MSGITAPAKTPVSSRTTTNCQVVAQSAERAVHTVKPSAASRMTATRPWRSESWPYASWPAAYETE